MVNEVRQAVRSLASSRWVTVLAIITLAVGIGASAAIYSVVYTVIYRPLPFNDPERLVDIRAHPKGRPEWRTALSYLTAQDVMAESKTLAAMGVWRPISLNLVDGANAQRVEAVLVSPGVTAALETKALLGRTFEAGEGSPGRTNLVLLSERLWRTTFNADPSIVGRSIRLNSEPHAVIGVMPSNFRFPVMSNRSELWVPIRAADNEQTMRGNRAFQAIGRVRPEFTVAQASTELAAIYARLEQRHPALLEGFSMRAAPLQDDATFFVRAPMRLLLGAVGVLLLVACMNVASLLLARTAARQQEIAIRVALGATRFQLARQFGVEGLVLSLSGGLLGCLVAAVALPALTAMVAELPRASEIRLDAPVLAAAIGAALATGLLFSLAPLWQTARTDVREMLLEGSRGTSSRRTRQALRALVAVEIALAFVLVLAAGVLGRTLVHLSGVDPGVRTDGILTAQVTLPEARYPDQSGRFAYYQRALDAIRALPGVESAGAVSILPTSFWGRNSSMTLPGDETPRNLGQTVEFRVVSRDYFRTMSIRVVRGADFSSVNAADKPEPVVINETCARLVFKDTNPVGREAVWGLAERIRVVGVVTDVRNMGLNRRPRPEAYFLLDENALPQMAFVAHYPGNVMALAGPMRQRLAAIDPEVPLFRIVPMTEIVGFGLTGTRHQTALMAILAAIALVLGAIGGYGVMSYSVAERTRELGIRMALGAPQSAIVRLVLREVSLVTLAGLGGGIVAAWAFSGLLQTLVVGVAALDPATGIAAALVLGGSAIAAGIAPARRASRVDPMVAIRHDGGVRAKMLPAAHVDDEEPIASDRPDLLDELPAAVRHAESSEEIFAWVTEHARAALGVESVTLFVRDRTGAFVSGAITLPAESFLVRRLAGLRHPFEIAAGELDTWERAIGAERAAEIAALRAADIHFATRIHHKEDTTGVLCAGPTLPGMRFGVPEKRLMMSLAGQLALVIENARLASRIGEQERLRRELALAAEVQRRLFPAVAPRIPGVDMAGICLPARGIGGDYFDFIELPDGRIGLALADVAGKGIAAALLMSIVQASLRSVVSGGPSDLPEVIGRVNRLLCRSAGPASYATFFYGEYDPRTRRLTYVNAGHNPPYLIHERVNGRPRLLQTGGPVIGLLVNPRFESETIELQPGDLVLAYSDGASEAQNLAEEEYGEDRLVEGLSARRAMAAAAICDGLVADLRVFMAGAPQYDDLTLVVFRVTA